METKDLQLHTYHWLVLPCGTKVVGQVIMSQELAYSNNVTTVRSCKAFKVLNAPYVTCEYKCDDVEVIGPCLTCDEVEEQCEDWYDMGFGAGYSEGIESAH